MEENTGGTPLLLTDDHTLQEIKVKTSTKSSGNFRRHDIDALRAIAFGLLIAYHVGMFYVTWDWHVKSEYPAEWLELLMLLLNQWRIPLIFLVSGLAVNFLLGEDKPRRMGFGQFAVLRVKRLLLPLFFGMAVIIPPQAYYEALSNGATEPGYVAFLIRYFTFQPWPAGAFAGSDIGITWNHLWYLPYLLFYTLLLIPLTMLIDGPLAGLRRSFRSMRGIWLIVVPIAWLTPLGLFVYPSFPYISHDLVTDWYAHSMYGSFFLFGYLLGRDAGLWAELARLRNITLPAALLSFAGLMFVNEAAVADPGPLHYFVQTVVIFTNRWLWIMLVLGWGHHLLNKPMRWLDYANRAVYPWYILHQTVVVVAGYQLSRLTLGPVAEPLVLIALTIMGCAGGMWLVESWLTWLRPVMGMKTSVVAARGGSASDGL